MVSGQQEGLVNARRSLTERGDGETKWIARERGRGPEGMHPTKPRYRAVDPSFDRVAPFTTVTRLQRHRGLCGITGGGGNGCARETRFYQPLITRPKSNVRGAAAGIRLSRATTAADITTG